MYINRYLFYTPLIIILFLLTGCAASYAPDDWLPETEDIPKSERGGWITIIVSDTVDKQQPKLIQYSGEFLGIDTESVYILYDSLYILKRTTIQNSIVELDQKHITGYGIWTCLGVAASFTNGVLMIITAPIWIISGTLSVTGETYRDRYEQEFPGDDYWKNVNKFSRFPQGLEGIILNDIQKMNIITEEPD